MSQFADEVHCADYVLGMITSGPTVEDFLDQVHSATTYKVSIGIFIIYVQTDVILLHFQNTTAKAKASEGIYF